MKMFILKNCLHCKRAQAWITKLKNENPMYQNIEIELIDEQINSEVANQYDYYYVPCFFDGDQKLHEGVASKEIIQNIFDDYLRRKK